MVLIHFLIFVVISSTFFTDNMIGRNLDQKKKSSSVLYFYIKKVLVPNLDKGSFSSSDDALGEICEGSDTFFFFFSSSEGVWLPGLRLFPPV